MIDIQPDSPVPVHEQIAGQIRAHVASGILGAGAALPEYRALAQQLLTNPQVVARAYGDLEWDGVLQRDPAGGMVVTSDAAVICRLQQQHAARQRLAQAVREARAAGLAGDDVRAVVEQELADRPAAPAAAKEPGDVSGHRASQGIKKLSRQEGRGPAQPGRPPGGDIRPARR